MTSWRFDQAVADRFQREAFGHIPGYSAVLDLCVEIAGERIARDDLVLEIGCARGETLGRFIAAGFSNLIGTDSAAPMVQACRERFPDIDIQQTEGFPDCLPAFVAANWTLHFIALPQARRAFLETIWERLASGGALFLTDKMACTPYWHDRYHAFKRAQGVPDAEIEAKAASLVGVLEPLPLPWYLTTLSEIGFAVDVVAAHGPMISLLAQK